MVLPGSAIDQRGARHLPRLHRRKNQVENLLLAQSRDDRQSFAIFEHRAAAHTRRTGDSHQVVQVITLRRPKSASSRLGNPRSTRTSNLMLHRVARKSADYSARQGRHPAPPSWISRRAIGSASSSEVRSILRAFSGTAGTEVIALYFGTALMAGVVQNIAPQATIGSQAERRKPLGYLKIERRREDVMLNQSTILSEISHFHPHASAAPPTPREAMTRNLAAAADSTPRRRVPPKQISCKTCMGKCCIGKCRF